MPLHHITPLFKHFELSNKLHKNIWLKMDCYQPVLSFKIRGIGALCEYAQQNNYKHIICASGGNAGYAASYAAYMLGLQATIFMPLNSSIFTQRKIKNLNAQIILSGECIDETTEIANNYATQHNAFF